MADKSKLRCGDDRFSRIGATKRRRGVMDWVGDTVRGFFTAPSWMFSWPNYDTIADISEGSHVNPINVTDDEDNEMQMPPGDEDNPSKRRRVDEQTLKGTETSANIHTSHRVAGLKQDSSLLASSFEENGLVPSKKRRVSFNSQTKIREINQNQTESSEKDNFAFHRSFRQNLNKTSDIASHTFSPFVQDKNMSILNQSKLSSKFNLGVYNSPLSKSFSHSMNVKMTPQLPIGESKCYNSEAQNDRIPSNLTSTFDPSVIASPNFRPAGPPNRGTPRCKVRRSEKSAVALSGNAQKILEKLEQPVTHTEIHRMRLMGPLRSFEESAAQRLGADQELNGFGMVPTTPLPSFSFLSSKRVMPAAKSKVSPPQFKSRSIDHRKVSAMGDHNSHSIVEKTNDQFSFASPIPKEFDFIQKTSNDKTQFDERKERGTKFPETDVFPNVQSIKGDTILSDSVPSNTEIKQGKTTLFEKFKPAADSWTCDLCLVVNKGDASNCVACQSIKPKSAAGSDRNTKSALTSSLVNSGFSNKLAEKFKPSAGSWDCDTCLVTNKEGDAKCVACESTKPVSKPSAALSNSAVSSSVSTFKLAEKFKPAAGTWSCDTCLVNNKAEDTKCVACETAKPNSGGGTPVKSTGSIFKTNPSVFGSITEPKEGAPQFKFGVGSGPSCVTSSKSASTSSNFIFGSSVTKSLAPVTPSSNGQSKTPTFTFGSGSSFGAGNANGNNPTPMFSFGVKPSEPPKPVEPSETANTKKNVTFSFSMPAAKTTFAPASEGNPEAVSTLTNGCSSKTGTAFSAPSFSFSAPSTLSTFKTSVPATTQSLFVFNGPSKQS